MDNSKILAQLPMDVLEMAIKIKEKELEEENAN